MEGMKRIFATVLRATAAILLAWATAAVCSSMHSNRSVASMALVLEVISIAALGDWLIALLTTVTSSLVFGYYFVDNVAFRMTSGEAALTFSMMVLTSLTGSYLAIRAHRRTAEAIRRR